MVNIAASMADIFGALGGLTFEPTSAGGNVFVSWMPPKPDVAVSVTVTGETREMGWGMEDERDSTLLVKVRARSMGEGYALMQTISDSLHVFRDGGLWNVIGGSGVVKIIGVQVTNHIFYEMDTNNLPIHLVGVTVRWSEPTS